MLHRVNLKSLGLLLLLGVIWGSGYALARFATTHGVPPMGYACWQSLGPAILLSLYVFLTQGRVRVPGKTMVFMFSIGLLGIALPNTNMYYSSQHLPAGVLAVIVNTVPIFIYFLAVALKDERYDWIRILCVLLAVIGIFMIVFPQTTRVDALSVRWLAQSFFSPLCFALVAVWIARTQSDCSGLILACGMMLASSCWLLPMTMIMHHFYLPELQHWQMRDTVIVAEILLSSLGYVVFFHLLQSAGSVYYSFVSGVVAIMGLIWGRLLFNEIFTVWTFLGLACILVATSMVSLFSTRVSRP